MTAEPLIRRRTPVLTWRETVDQKALGLIEADGERPRRCAEDDDVGFSVDDEIPDTGRWTVVRL